MGVRDGIVSLFDAVLDRAVVPGYTRIGYRLRTLEWPDDPPVDALRGRTALVTGSNRGLGKAIAAGLAGLGATVLLTVRDGAKGSRRVRRSSPSTPVPTFASKCATCRTWPPCVRSPRIWPGGWPAWTC